MWKGGQCIYCGATRYSETREHLGDEHIIPDGLGGRKILERASCLRCEKMTNESETFCQKEMMQTFRSKMHIKSTKKRKSKTPTALPVEFLINGQWVSISVPIADYPLNMPIPTLPIPDLLRPHPVEKSHVIQFSLIEFWSPQTIAVLLHKYHAEHWQCKSGSTKLRPFIRMLAKIAHAYAVSQLDLGGFHPLLMPIIEGNLSHGHFFVGSTTEMPHPRGGHDLDIKCETHHGKKYWIVRIRMFTGLGFPEYICVAGLHLDETDLSLPAGFSSERPWRIPLSEIGADERGELIPRARRQVYVHPMNSEGDPSDVSFQTGFQSCPPPQSDKV